MGDDKSLNYKFIIAFVILLVSAILMFNFPLESKDLIKSFLESQWTNYLIAAITIIIYILYFIFSNDKNYNLKPLITPYFGHFFDIVIGGVGIATGITSSLTILKGIFLQEYYNIIYFNEFDQFDKWLLFLTMSFLLYFLIMKVGNIIKEIIWVERITKIDP